MASKTFYLLHFFNGTPTWEFFDGRKLEPVSEPGGRVKTSVVALIPDRHMFFFQPKGSEGGGKKLRAAAEMQMQFLFPRMGGEQERGVLTGSGQNMLGFFSAPGFKAFWEEHKKLLERANVVTTSFVMAWQAAHALGRQAFSWTTPDGLTALYAQDQLHYFPGDEAECRKRAEELGVQDENLTLSWEDALSALHQGKLVLPRLRLPLMHSGAADTLNARRWGWYFAAVALLGLLFCAGEFMRHHSLRQEANRWDGALVMAYKSILGPNPGNDPYGRLLAQIERLRGSHSQGLPVLRLVAELSENAPEGFTIDNMVLSGDGGTLRARIGSYNELDEMLSRLKDTEFGYTLEQAVNTNQGILITLRVQL